MSYMGMFDKMCTVYRSGSGTLDPEFNEPQDAPVPIGEYPCRLGRTSGSINQQQPQLVAYENTRLYTIGTADIKKGDIIVVNGDKYKAELPHKPSVYQLEVDISCDGEV
ncbi:hypothetical protein Ccar_16540 [Clostridium carboxidivorans P7]|uniref:DUF3599 family protein n=1 Tax=Clostridium carboxidivorans TaxID=217159 RepID=UPI00064E18CA|nr:DUF3599 family protein [Clostridium carboxidivorans]AKN32381.1 hypothetical protein Ccar_16540 [Clostridium carboxidivorans P7]